VLVPDGDTVVIAGLVRRSKIVAPKGKPEADIPVVGELFKSRLEAQPDKELLIFVTPRIIGEIPPT